MNDDNDWEKLVREVERAQAAKRAQNTPRELAPGLDVQSRRRVPVVPNVLPRYMVKPAELVRQRSVLPAFLKVSIVLAVVLAGAYYLRQNYEQPSHQSAESVTPTVTVPATQQGSGGWSARGGGNRSDSGDGSGSLEFRASIQSALEGRLRPAGVIEALYGNQKLEWLKISTMDLPKYGKPRVVSAVLYARLDDATEKRWRDAGLFKSEGIIATPFVRKVTISNREDLDLLLDWHVEGVVASLPIKAIK